MTPCSIESCPKISHARGWCRSHYMRNRDYGNPEAKFLRHAPAYDRMIARGVERYGECLLFAAAPNNYGYGFIRDSASSTKSKIASTHRVSYEKWFGKIPDEMQIDHTCHNEALKRGECQGGRSCPHRRCINPGHLEIKTIQENLAARRIGLSPISGLPCIVLGCKSNKISRRGYCSKHRARVSRSGQAFIWKSGSRGGRVNLEIHELKGARSAEV